MREVNANVEHAGAGSVETHDDETGYQKSGSLRCKKSKVDQHLTRMGWVKYRRTNEPEKIWWYSPAKYIIMDRSSGI